ncbi:MAG: PEGA domain-containing protein [Bacteroidetes bacterium]|nr:PEGA domain-containing protein [Bacteroidota bacterium]
MKRNFLILIFLILSSSLFAQSDSSFYNLSVNSLPDNYDVYIDSTLIGKAPLVNYKLKPSVYTLKILNWSSLKDWETESKIITLELKSDTSFTVTFRNEYFINTVPSNASVIKNDSTYGFTPLRLFSKEKLSGNFILRKEGYFDKTINFDNLDFGRNIVETLTPSGITKNNVWKNKNTNFNAKRNFPLIGILGAAIAGTTFGTFHFKSVANDAYDRYLITYNQADYDESKTNDTYSVIFLIATQITLGALVYFLFGD